MNKNLDLRLNFVPLSCHLPVILPEELNRLLILAVLLACLLPPSPSLSLLFSCSSNSHSHFYSLPFYRSLELLFVVPVSCPIFSLRTFVLLIPSFVLPLAFSCSSAAHSLFTSRYYFFYSSNFLSISFRSRT